MGVLSDDPGSSGGGGSSSSSSGIFNLPTEEFGIDEVSSPPFKLLHSIVAQRQRAAQHESVVEFIRALVLLAVADKVILAGMPLALAISVDPVLSLLAAVPAEQQAASGMNSSSSGSVGGSGGSNSRLVTILEANSERIVMRFATSADSQSANDSDGDGGAESWHVLSAIEHNSNERRLSLSVRHGSEATAATALRFSLYHARADGFSHVGNREALERLLHRAAVTAIEPQSDITAFVVSRTAVRHEQQQQQQQPPASDEDDETALGYYLTTSSLRMGIREEMQRFSSAAHGGGHQVFLMSSEREDTVLPLSYHAHVLSHRDLLLRCIGSIDDGGSGSGGGGCGSGSSMAQFAQIIESIESPAATQAAPSPSPATPEARGSQASDTAAPASTQAIPAIALVISGTRFEYASNAEADELARVMRSCRVVIGCEFNAMQRAKAVGFCRHRMGRTTAVVAAAVNNLAAMRQASVGVALADPVLFGMAASVVAKHTITDMPQLFVLLQGEKTLTSASAAAAAAAAAAYCCVS